MLTAGTSSKAQVFDLEPHLALSFPFQQGAESTTVKYPVMLAPNFIMKPGDQLRIAYVPLRNDDAETIRQRNTSNKDSVLTRKNGPQDEGPKLTPAQLATQKMIRETKWAEPKRFQLAFDNLRDSDLSLVYLRTNPVDLIDVHFDFPEGMFLAEIDGSVRVLAVEKNSKAMQMGIKAGDVILKIGGISVGNTLEGFAKAYSATKRALETSGKKTFPIAYRPGGTGAETTGEVKAPATLKGSIMDM